MPADVFDGQSAGKPLALVESPYFKDVVGQSGMIEVVGVHFRCKAVQADKRICIGVEKRAVGL